MQDSMPYGPLLYLVMYQFLLLQLLGFEKEIFKVTSVLPSILILLHYPTLPLSVLGGGVVAATEVSGQKWIPESASQMGQFSALVITVFALLVILVSVVVTHPFLLFDHLSELQNPAIKKLKRYKCAELADEESHGF